MKVFIGTINIASQIADWERGFKSIGCDTMTASYGNHAVFVDGNVEHDLSRERFHKVRPHRLRPVLNKFFGSQSQFILKKAIKECDVFLFIWSTFLPDYSDLELIRSKGKKIIFIQVGDDVRWKPALDQEFSYLNNKFSIEYDNYDYSEEALNNKLRHLRNAELFADIIYSAPNQSQLALKPYNYLGVNLWTSDFTENRVQRKRKPKVLHAPTHAAGKGTKYVLQAFERLTKEGIEFEPVLLQNVSYADAKKIYTDCDILVGQLLTPGGGKQERELLACGKVVLTSLRPEYETRISKECPIIDVNPETLYQELKNIILDYEKRSKLANGARAYVNKYHNPSVLCQRVIDDAFDSNKEKPYDYYPTFFRQHFIPENENLVSTYNNWTSKLMETQWYKQFVPDGCRNGLIF